MKGTIYKYENGAVVELLTGKEPSGEKRELKELTQDAGQEKHLPIVEKTSTGITVKVGSVPHPMEEDHWIEWIEVIAKDAVYRKYLNPGDKPEASFPPIEGEFLVRELCNKHGLWKA